MSDGEFERTPPSDVAAEQCVLGAMMLTRRAIEDVAEVLRSPDFYRPAHQSVYDAILALYERGEPADPVTVCAELTRTGDLDRIGGAPYLHTLMAVVPTAANAGYYARTVRERAIQRRLAEAGSRIVQVAYAGTEPEAALDLAWAEVEAAEGGRRDDARRLGEDLDDVLDGLDNPGPARGVDLPWGDLASYVGPLEPGTLTVVGARPAVGKSTVATDLARHTAIRRDRPVLLVSLEMTRDEVARDVLSAEAEVTLDRLQGRRRPDEAEWGRIAKHADEVRGAPLVVDDTPGADLGSLRASVRRHRPELLIVDYAQLVTPPKSGRGDRQESMDALARGLKLLAKSEDLPVMVLAQLNRGPEARSGGIPQMSDLRETGGWEQHADVVLLLHRPELRDPTDRPQECDVIVAKNRHGRTGTATLLCQLHYARFVSSAGGWT